MAYSEILASQIEIGEPTAKEIFQKVRDNFIDHETRLSAAEGALNVFRPIVFNINGAYWVHAPKDEVLTTRINFDINLLSGRILVYDAGTSGTLLIDVEYKRGAGAWTTVFQTQPSVVYTAGDYALSTNGVLTADIIANGLETADLLRLNIDTGQVGNTMFDVIMEFEKS